MNCFLTKLKFDAPVHFGSGASALSLCTSEDHFRADTLFSALCHTALRREGANGPAHLARLVREGRLRLSDAMPWKGEEFYLPMPAGLSGEARELPWLPAGALAGLSGQAASGADSDCFGIAEERILARVSGAGEAQPYSVGLYQFREDCGLYVLVETEEAEDAEWILKLIRLLGASGIGGRVSSGFGAFSVIQSVDLGTAEDEQGKWLNAALQRTEGRQLLLTSSLPKDEELDAVLEGAAFQLVRRGGYAALDASAEAPRRKRTQYFLAAGAVLPCRFEGDLYEVGAGAGHPVYRYARPILLGVSL